jgi:hypothetical protein
MRWNVRKHPAVIAYVNRIDAPPALNAALARLFDGVPADARHLHTRQDGVEVWEWLEARYWIISTVDRTVNRRTIRVVEIESATVDSTN